MLPSKGVDKMHGLENDIIAQINNWQSLECLDVMALTTHKIAKTDLIKFITSKLQRVGPTLSIGVAAFLIALGPEERSPIHILQWNGCAWESDIFGKNFPGVDCFVAYIILSQKTRIFPSSRKMMCTTHT